MYNNKFVLSLFVNGKPAKELQNGVVLLNYGDIYTIRLRNKHDRNAVAKIFIDGENVSGNGYLIPPHNFVDIRRWYCEDRAFKFVPKDSIEAIREGKSGPNEDGSKSLIEARFYLEKEVSPQTYIQIYPFIQYYPPYYPYYTNQPIWIHNSSNTNSSQQENYTYYNCSNLCPQPQYDEGRTVKGDPTYQKFYHTSVYLEDSYTSLRLILLGKEKCCCCCHEKNTNIPTEVNVPVNSNDKETLEELKKQYEYFKKMYEDKKAEIERKNCNTAQ